MKLSKPILFSLQRDTDVSGVSGTGTVAYGVVFPDGRVATRWNGKVAQTCAWESLDDVKAVHGHNGATRVVLNDPADRMARIAEAHCKDIGEGGLTSGDCAECGHPYPCPTRIWATTERDPLLCWDPADDDPDATP